MAKTQVVPYALTTYTVQQTKGGHRLHLGDSTDAVLREIGLSESEIENLLSEGVVAKPN